MGSDDPSAKTLRVDASCLCADAVTVDMLARLQLTACRCGFRLWLRGSSVELRELIEFAGLAAVLPEEPLMERPLMAEPRTEGPLRLDPGR